MKDFLKIRPIARMASLLAVVLLSVCSSVHAENLVLGTYNVRYDNSEDTKQGNGWTTRAPVVAGIIRFHDFDVIGTQEALPNQMEDLRKMLPDHETISYGRDDGTAAGEHIGVFYKKDRFTALESGRFWLSSTPQSPGVGWDAMLPRICTWVKLQSKETQHVFYFFNVHFDHRGATAKLESAKLMLQEVQRIAKGTPSILTGDFNLSQSSEGYQLINKSELVKDSHDTAKFHYAMTGTVNSFDSNHHTDIRIDHVFLSSHFQVQMYGVLTDTYRKRIDTSSDGLTQPQSLAGVPSDHLPVMVRVELHK